MKKIMLLGSGELGKEFVIACKRKGQYVIACDSYTNSFTFPVKTPSPVLTENEF
jgi:phosphoribosylglycinamide formyltransferase 2